MKKIFIILGITVTFLAACERDDVGDTYDFSTSLPPNVELNSTVRGKTISVKEGKKFKVPVILRTSMQQAVSVNYSITGAFTQQGVLQIDRNTVTNTSKGDSILVPVGTVPVGSTTATATLRIVSAKNAANDTLAVGRFGKDLAFVKIKIYK